MKAAVLHKIGDLRYEEVETPHPGPGEVLVKVRVAGICGSDLARVMKEGTYSFPLIPGHEFSGEVVSLGPEVQDIPLGCRVTVIPLIPCRHCPLCRIGEYAQCDDYNYLGSRTNGGFAEFVSVPADNIVRIPQGVSFEEAALTEPASVALHALRRSRPDSGDSIAIFGAGPIGIILAQWARIMGGGKIFLVDIVRKKLEVAADFGFEYLIDASKADPVKEIVRQTDNKGVDMSIEGAGRPITFLQALKVVRKLGQVILMGNMQGQVVIPPPEFSSILRRQLVIHGTWNSSFTPLPKHEWQTGLEFIASGRLHLKPLISHRFSPDRAKEVFERLATAKEFFNKVIFIFD
jgi:L-iditol 2-dehydrogenase